MKKSPPKPIKWEMTEEEDEAMINQAMMLQEHNSNRKAGELSKCDIEKAGEMEEGTRPLAEPFPVDEDFLNRLREIEDYVENSHTESPDQTPAEIRRQEMEKRTKENEERIIARLMQEEGMAREQAEAKLNWPL